MSVQLKPIPGFCIKTTNVQPAVYTPATHPQPQNVLEPPPIPIHIPPGLKIFVNIAWDPNVPPPPPGNEDAIQRAMQGEDLETRDPDAWYVPVVVSEGRQDKDKAGKPSLVFDCIYNSSVKLRTLTDPEFKVFLIELALQRIEAQTSLILSREIGTPNIASKGKLTPRTVSIPSFLSGESSQKLPPLIEEVAKRTPAPSPPPTKLKSILKTKQQTTPSLAKNSLPTWKWSTEGAALRIVIQVPPIDRTLIEQAILDIESRRFIVLIPDCPVLDVNLDISDAEIVATASSKTSGTLGDGDGEPSNTLTLKRQRDFDIQGATSEWHIDQGILVINA